MNKYRSGTRMHLMDEKCHDDNGDDDEDDDVGNDCDEDELMMVMVTSLRKNRGSYQRETMAGENDE